MEGAVRAERDLIAVGYPDRETAENVRQTLARLTTERVIELAVDNEAETRLRKALRTPTPAAAAVV